MIKPLKLLHRRVNKQDAPVYSDALDSIILQSVRYFCFLSLCVACLTFVICLLILLISDESSNETAQILLFSLGLIGASATFAISIWRGEQIDTQIQKAQEQIDKTQEQNRLTHFQNAIEMATEKDNAGRCAAGLRILASIYEKIEKKGDEKTDEERLDQQTIHSAALYVLSLEKDEKRVSSTARQWALDILVRGGFLSYKAHIDNEEEKKAGNDGMEISIANSTIEKDFSYLDFTRSLKDEEKPLNLSHFSLNECDFFKANLSDVNFSNASFLGANLSECSLTNTNFEDASLLGTDISGANLMSTINLTYEQLDLTYCGKIQPKINSPLHIRWWDEWHEFFYEKKRNFIEKCAEYKRHHIHLSNDLELELKEWDYMEDFISRHNDNSPWNPNN